MENECLLDMNTETISPPSSLKDQSLNSFSHNLTGRLGVNLGTETVIHETKNASTSTSGVVSSLHQVNQAIKRELIDPRIKYLRIRVRPASNANSYAVVWHKTLFLRESHHRAP